MMDEDHMNGEYGITPVSKCACETERPGHLYVPGVLCSCVSEKELHPLRRFAAIFVKGAAVKAAPFAYFTA